MGSLTSVTSDFFFLEIFASGKMIFLSLVSTLLLLSASFAKHHSKHHSNQNVRVAADSKCDSKCRRVADKDCENKERAVVTYYYCFKENGNGVKPCSSLRYMCDKTEKRNECKDLDEGYCNPDECKKHGLPLNATNQNGETRHICIPKALLCDGVEDVDDDFADGKDKYDEKHCMNGGTCNTTKEDDGFGSFFPGGLFGGRHARDTDQKKPKPNC